MYPIKETRKVNTSMGMKLKNVCIGKDGKEICQHWDSYYYINKNNTVSKRRYDYENIS